LEKAGNLFGSDNLASKGQNMRDNAGNNNNNY
jgi:hypothetical protein